MTAATLVAESREFNFVLQEEVNLLRPKYYFMQSVLSLVSRLVLATIKPAQILSPYGYGSFHNCKFIRSVDSHFTFPLFSSLMRNQSPS